MSSEAIECLPCSPRLFCTFSTQQGEVWERSRVAQESNAPRSVGGGLPMHHIPTITESFSIITVYVKMLSKTSDFFFPTVISPEAKEREM